MFEELDRLWDENTTISLTRYTYSKWNCEISRSRDGVQLKVDMYDDTVGAVVVKAVEAFKRLTGEIPELRAPMLEHQSMTAEESAATFRRAFDSDEIPF